MLKAYLGELVLLGPLGNGVRTILATNFLASFGIFMALPFYTIYLVRETALSLTDAAIIFGTTVWLQHGGALIGGIAADRFGLRVVMNAGLMLRIPAYVLLALADGFWPLLAGGALLGSGSALYLPAAKTALINLSDDNSRAAILSARNICNNAGVALGPLAGSLVFAFAPHVLFLGIAGLFLALAIMNLRLDIPTQSGANKFRFSQVLRLVAQPAVVVLCVNMMFFFVFYIQLEVLVPVGAFELFGGIGASAVFVINALVVVLAQPPMVSWIRQTPRVRIFSGGFAIIGMAYVLLSLAGIIPVFLFAAVAVLSLAEVLLTLRLDLETSALSRRYTGTCFGLLGLSAGMGAFAGSSLGAAIQEHYQASGNSFAAWQLFAVAAIVVSAASAALWFMVQARPTHQDDMEHE